MVSIINLNTPLIPEEEYTDSYEYEDDDDTYISWWDDLSAEDDTTETDYYSDEAKPEITSIDQNYYDSGPQDEKNIIMTAVGGAATNTGTIAPACDWRPMRNSISNFPSFTWNLMKQSSYRRGRQSKGKGSGGGTRGNSGIGIGGGRVGSMGSNWGNSNGGRGNSGGQGNNSGRGNSGVQGSIGGRGNSGAKGSSGGRGNSAGRGNSGLSMGTGGGGRFTGLYGMGSSWLRSMGNSGGGGMYWSNSRGNSGGRNNNIKNQGWNGSSGRGSSSGGRNNGMSANLQSQTSCSRGCQLNQVALTRAPQWNSLCTKRPSG